MIVRLQGGLGNQLFQYAFGRSVSLARKIPLQFNWQPTSWPYALGPYNLNIQWSSEPAPTYMEQPFSFNPGVYDADPKSLFVGYWQTEKYFNEEVIRTEIVPRHDVAVPAGIFTQGSVAVHVRRGDYLQVYEHQGNVLGMDYYSRAMEYVKSRISDARFYIFSDDPGWCWDNFPFECPVISKIKGNQHDDLYLMSQCHHAIIANSSFSWWGAWLNPNKDRIVVAPKKWFHEDAGLDDRDLVPERWVRL